MTRQHLTHNGAIVSIKPADYILQGHKPKTDRVIERVVEYAENASEPFTTTECWRQAYGHYSCVTQTLRSMINAGLLVVVNPGRNPRRLLRADRFAEWTAQQNTPNR